MTLTLRILTGLVGLLFLVNGINWLFDPASAADGLGMSLQTGVGLSTQIGDTGSFFLAGSIMAILGAVTLRPTWLHAAAMMVGIAAIYRIAAWAVHGAPFATTFIIAEVVMTVILVAAATRFSSQATTA